MKKIYLAIIFCCFCVSGFATTWYSQNSGDASILANWNDSMDGSGAAPVTFDSSGDLWIMQDSMTCSASSFFIAGSLTIDSAYFASPDTILSIGGNLTLTGAAIIDAGTPDAGPNIIAISGNLSITGTSYVTNYNSWTTIVFNNTSSTVAIPQTITWTSATIGDYAQMNINAGCVVQLLSNVTMPFDPNASDSVNGTLICGNYVLNCGANPHGFQLSSGATLYTANTWGLDSSVINAGSPLTYSAAANYVFNGSARQFTGLLLPSLFMAGGSLTSSNAAGVTLSQNTGFGSGSTLSLAGGILILGANNLNLDVSSSLTGVFSSADMIITNGSGQLQQQFSVNGSFLYPVGDTAGNYSPITLNVTGSSYAAGSAYAGVTVTNSKEPHNANENNYLNRYWSIALSGITSPSYTVTGATYAAPGDVVGSDANISAGLYAGALPWIKFGPANTVAHTLSSTAITDTMGNFTGISTAGPSISSSPGIALCFGQSTLLTLSSAGDTPLAYSWAPAAGLSATTGTSVTAMPDTTTAYTVTVTDANGFMATATTIVTINPLPPLHTVTGGGSYCAGTGGVHVGLNGSDPGISYQLLLNDTLATGSPVAGTGASLDFGLDTAAGVYSVVATDTTTLCTANMAGSTVIAINPLPALHTLTGGGSYCPGTGGVHVGLNGSDTGIRYQLFLNDTLAIGGPMAGTGASLDFGLDTAGVYSVVATDTTTLCTANMAGSAVIAINPLPALHTLTGGGSYCLGTGGVHVGLNGSDTGVYYQLYYHDTTLMGGPVAGTGAALDFGLETGAGAYTAIATGSTTGCSRNMADSSVIIVNPLPAVHTVTGGGSYCAGTGGVHIGLNGSDTGIHYQLYYQDTITVGTSVAGTGSLFTFGLDTAAGIYTVIAANSSTGCSSNMTGSASVVITPVVIPSVSISSSITDTICAGETITFTAAPVHGGGEPEYQWMVNGTVEGFHGNAYSYVPANGDIVSVKLTSDTVCAIPDTATDTMTVIVHPRVLPTVTLSVAPGDTICEGTSVVITATPGYGGNAPAYTWIKNTVIVSTDSIYSYTPAMGDNIYCIMQSNYFCLYDTATTAYSNVIDMIVETPVVPSVYITVDPGTYVGIAKPDSFTAIVTNGGADPSYQWYINGAPYAGATLPVFILPTLLNKDSISCIVTRNDVCHLSTFSSVIVRVGDLGVQQAASSGNDITLVPNPNNGVFTITGSFGSSVVAGEEVTVEITDMLGQIVYRNKITSQNGGINAEVQANTLTNGVYILTLHSQSGNSAIRFVVAR